MKNIYNFQVPKNIWQKQYFIKCVGLTCMYLWLTILGFIGIIKSIKFLEKGKKVDVWTYFCGLFLSTNHLHVRKWGCKRPRKTRSSLVVFVILYLFIYLFILTLRWRDPYKNEKAPRLETLNSTHTYIWTRF